jgi:hypothetical protein
MSDRFQIDRFDDQPPELPEPSTFVEPSPPFPAWLAVRFLRPDEKITWVRGPRFNPSWELYVTHPALLLAALAVGALGVATAWRIAGSWSEMPPWPFAAAGALAFAAIVVLGVASGYFTRLAATNQRLVIVQGRELCRSWTLDDLPPSMIRRRMRGDGRPDRAIDLDAVKTLLGGASDGFADAKSILAFGKQLGQIKSREDGRNR